MSDSVRNWWTTSSTQNRKALAGAVALVTVLAVVCGFIWISPTGNKVAQSVVKAAAKATTSLNPLAVQNEKLTQQLASLNKQLGQAKSQLAASKSSSASQLAAAQAKVTAAQNKLNALQAQVGGAKGATTASGSHSATTTTHSSTGTGTSGSSTAAAPIVAPTKAALVNPTQRYFGLYTEQAPFNFATYDQASQQIGDSPTVVGYFDGWDEGFRAQAVTAAWQRNTLPMLTWESRPLQAANNETSAPAYSLPLIINGSFDTYLKQYAASVVSTGLPLVIRFDHEMNATWYPWSEDDGHGTSINGNQTGDYVQAWQHVWNIFQAAGANNYVIWDWSPNRIDNLTASHQTLAYTKSMYPGDQYVDWVGMSGYMRPPFTSGEKIGFTDTFGRTLAQLRDITNKPIFLSEIGASETGGNKPAWFTSLFTDGFGNPANSDIIGFAYFNETVSTYIQGQLGTNDWRIDSRAESLAAFTAGLNTPGLNFKLVPDGTVATTPAPTPTPTG